MLPRSIAFDVYLVVDSLGPRRFWLECLPPACRGFGGYAKKSMVAKKLKCGKLKIKT